MIGSGNEESAKGAAHDESAKGSSVYEEVKDPSQESSSASIADNNAKAMTDLMC
jgi:hypothetical protein